jgi:hypothetical protein
MSSPNVENCIQNLEVNFNHHFLEFILAQNKGLQAPIFENDDKAQEQLQIADEAYQKWYQIIKEDPSTSIACTRFFASCKDNANLLLARDTQFFNTDGIDIFAVIFEAPGYDFMYRYSMFDHTSKGIFWNVFVDIYRLSILNSIYNNIPEVRKILNILLKDAQGVNAGNLMNNVKNCLKHNKEFQKLFKRLMKQGEAKVTFIFESINYVLSAIQSNVPDPWDDWVRKTNTDISVEDHKVRVNIYQAFTTQDMESCKRWLSPVEIENLRSVWAKDTELQETVRKYLWSENSHEIQRVMECMKDGDDASIQNMMQNSTLFSGHVDSEIQGLMKEWEAESALDKQGFMNAWKSEQEEQEDASSEKDT